MSFANLPLTAVLAGLAALAALLFLLQQLRIRHTTVTVPTTLFWRAAAREAPVRVLRERFRHWLAYLLFFAICALLWLGFAAPEFGRQDGARHHVLFLDGSAHNAEGDDFARAVAALKADLRTLPDGRREVIWGGAHNVSLLAPGEDRLLLDQRLAGLTPEASPSGLGEQLRLASIPGAWPEQVAFVVYGRAPVDADVLQDVRPGVAVSRGLRYGEPSANRGIVALGLANALSGRWDRVDALVRLGASADESPDAVTAEQLSARVNDAPWPAAPEAADGGFVFRDLPAAGGLFTVALPGGDGLALDDQASVRLPRRSVLGVAAAPEALGAVADAIVADPGLRLAMPDEAAVAVRLGGSTFGGDLPALVFVPMDAQESAFQITYPDASGEGFVGAETRLLRGLEALGLDQIDATGLATALGRPIGLVAVAGDRPEVALWAALLDEGFNFTAERDFPLFLSRALRYLAGEQAWPRYLAAATPVQDGVAGWSSATSPPALDAAGARFVPGPGSRLTREGDWAVALLNDAVTRREPGAEVSLFAGEVGAQTATAIATWLALLVIALLALEWALFRRGLVP